MSYNDRVHFLLTLLSLWLLWLKKKTNNHPSGESMASILYSLTVYKSKNSSFHLLFTIFKDQNNYPIPIKQRKQHVYWGKLKYHRDEVKLTCKLLHLLWSLPFFPNQFIPFPVKQVELRMPTDSSNYSQYRRHLAFAVESLMHQWANTHKQHLLEIQGDFFLNSFQKMKD